MIARSNSPAIDSLVPASGFLLIILYAVRLSNLQKNIAANFELVFGDRFPIRIAL